MRIFVVYDACSGGLPKVMLEISKAFVGKRHKVVACGPFFAHKKWAMSAKSAGVDLLNQGREPLLRLSGKVRKRLDDFNPNLLVSAHRGSDFRVFRYARSHSIPHIICLHENPVYMDKFNKIPFRFIRNYFWRLALRHACKVVAGSNYVASELIRSFAQKKEKIAVIPNCIRLENYSWASPRRSVNKTRLIRILAIGRLSPEKRPQLLVNLTEILIKKNIEVQATWVGDGPLRLFVEGYALKRGVGEHICFIGNDDFIETYYKNADIFVHFIIDEAFGLVLAEAQAAGLPIVAFNAGGIQEVVENGKTGILVEPLNVEKMASAIEHLLQRPDFYSSISRAAILSAKQRFSFIRFAEEYCNLAEKVLRNNATIFLESETERG